nr:NAD(P)/FAD-dependent oxidoreductase [Flavobacterium sp.]
MLNAKNTFFTSNYFTGEIVDVNAITGGFNFQNAWTSGFIVANALAIS